tara:strand:- start:1552 stop:2925 length:1374 start_codon:yes stop_codon:yes gene_type:complete
MALNPFFTQGTKNEQNLVQDLINEQLKMYGVECYYLPRKYLTTNTIIREVIQSKFDDAYPLEAYVNNYDVYQGNGTVLSKFGIEVQQDINLTISKDRFENYITPLIRNETGIKLSTRPKEGDIIWFPLDDRLYEIKFVEHAKPFYQLKELYVYELQCEVFRYEDETVDTGIGSIDDETEDLGYNQTLTLTGVGTTATAVTTFRDGGIQFIDLLNSGAGYRAAPTVAISSAPSGGITATAVAITTSVTGLTTSFAVESVRITNPGAGYTEIPAVAFSGGGGTGIAVTVGIATTGSVGVVTITDGGSGYYGTTPTITFSSPGTGVTALGEVVAAGGTIQSARLSNAGCGYTEVPTVTISNPGLLGSGDYYFNEEVTGGTTGTKARVKSWDATTKTLVVGIATGTFNPGESITGDESSAVYTLAVDTTDDLVTPYADNENIQSAGDDILDWTRKNPFGDA